MANPLGAAADVEVDAVVAASSLAVAPLPSPGPDPDPGPPAAPPEPLRTTGAVAALAYGLAFAPIGDGEAVDELRRSASGRQLQAAWLHIARRRSWDPGRRRRALHLLGLALHPTVRPPAAARCDVLAFTPRGGSAGPRS